MYDNDSNIALFFFCLIFLFIVSGIIFEIVKFFILIKFGSVILHKVLH